jgi:hypothetical protein
MTDTEAERARRQAENEKLFRDVNGSPGGDGDEIDLLCECGAGACAERLSVSLSDYPRVRRWDSRFLITPGHEDADFENVVERHKGWLVVQTHEPFRALPPEERRRPGRPWG